MRGKRTPRGSSQGSTPGPGKHSPDDWTMIRIQWGTLEKLWAQRRGERNLNQVLQRILSEKP